MDPKESLHLRLFALGAFMFAVLALFFGVLYDTQVTNHEKYLAQSIRSITRDSRSLSSGNRIVIRCSYRYPAKRWIQLPSLSCTLSYSVLIPKCAVCFVLSIPPLQW